MSNKNLNLICRHFFGVNTDIKSGLFLTDEDKHLIYPAGHNVVMYKIDDKEQFFMMGTLHCKLFFNLPFRLREDRGNHTCVDLRERHLCLRVRAVHGWLQRPVLDIRGDFIEKKKGATRVG